MASIWGTGASVALGQPKPGKVGKAIVKAGKKGLDILKTSVTKPGKFIKNSITKPFTAPIKWGKKLFGIGGGKTKYKITNPSTGMSEKFTNKNIAKQRRVYGVNTALPQGTTFADTGKRVGERDRVAPAVGVYKMAKAQGKTAAEARTLKRAAKWGIPWDVAQKYRGKPISWLKKKGLM